MAHMLLIANKKATFDYQIQQKFTAGLVLRGPEVKSLRLKQGSLTGSFIKQIGQQFLLVNAQIHPYAFADNSDYDPKRSRALLLRKTEIEKLKEELKQKGWTLVPLAIIVEHNRIKLEFGLGKGKKQYEKREVSKKRDLKRELSRDIKMSKLKF